jgi:hypothetical protein
VLIRPREQCAQLTLCGERGNVFDIFADLVC